ncbi:MAG: carbohydrate ABC transporter permease [Thermomicrobiales bacterium]
MQSESTIRIPTAKKHARPLVIAARHLALLALAATFVVPLYWMVTTSLRAVGMPPPLHLEWLPEPVVWGNYRRVFELVDFWRYALNSTFVVVNAVPITVIVASWAGFAMAQLPQQWRLRLTAISFIALMTPLTAVWLTRFLMFKEVGLIDSRWALVVPAFMGTSPFYVLLFLWTFLRIPSEIYDAARLDGAGALRIWGQIAMPLAIPTITAVGVLSFAYHWSAFIEPLLYIQSAEKLTLPTGLQALAQLDRTNWPVLMAGAVMVTAPVVAVFLLVQRAFLQDLRGSGWLGR